MYVSKEPSPFTPVTVKVSLTSPKEVGALWAARFKLFQSALSADVGEENAAILEGMLTMMYESIHRGSDMSHNFEE